LRRVEEPWLSCFQLAWESFQRGSLGIGALLVDGAGAVVATGRNRMSETDAPPGQIAGSLLAHAEFNALAGLPPGEYTDHTLYSTLEPCLLCTAALRYSHVGTVSYAASDPMWYGIDRIPELNHNMARRWARRVGPIDGPLRTWAGVLPLINALQRGIRSVVDCYALAMPNVLHVARTLEPEVDRLRAMTLAGALRTVWADLDGH
jgi:tRNA(Arg) A34 adenosine deaminase TadA